MIARILIFFLLLIAIPDAYLYKVLFHRRWNRWAKVAWWLVSAALLAYTLWLAHKPGFIPPNPWPVYIYLLILGTFIVPKALFALIVFIAAPTRRPGRKALAVATAFSIAVAAMVAYGATFGFYKIEVNRVSFSSPQLPPAFDGYKVALFSDLHLGSYDTESGRKVVEAAVDSIMAMGADLILFAGDLQNVRAEEITPFRATLSRLSAPDGVMAVMGNHDYAVYIDTLSVGKKQAEDATRKQIRRLGWDLLNNEHRYIARDSDTLVVAGMEDLGHTRSPKTGNVEKTLKGVAADRFVLMLQHEPYAWRKAILPQSSAQLTLSGHTHGGQVKVGPFSPYALIGECEGFYYEGDRALFVTRGLGGLVPFRFGATGEVVLLTLHCTK